MDQPHLDQQLHQRALQGLARVNRFSRSARILWRPIADWLRASGRRQLSLLDLGCGSGDVTVALWQLARHRGVDLAAVGWDFSPVAIETARQHAGSRQAAVRFEVHDAFQPGDENAFDVVCCSLFLHHQPEDSAVRLLTLMARQARHLVLVNDLVRSRVGYALAWVGSRLLTRSPVVHLDGPRSVAASFQLHEVQQLAHRAGLTRCQVQPRWPWRFLLSWSKPA